MKILLILEAERKDWYTYLKSDPENDYYLLWYESKSEIPVSILADTFFKEIYYWDQYLTPDSLLKRINPDRIVFFEIIDQRQIALLVTANKKKIKTIYLAHGASSDVAATILRSEQKSFFFKTKMKYLKERFKGSTMRMIKSKFFYYSSSKYLTSFSSLAKYLRLPFAMLRHTPNKALQLNKFKERSPNKFIVFNNSNFESMETYNSLTRDTVVYNGIPFFDKYFNSEISNKKHVVFIDHPYLENEILGWTNEFHKQVATTLYNFSKSRNIKCYIRLHPTSDIRIWKNYGYENPLFVLSQNDDFTEEILSSELILSYSSTLLTGALCAKKNIVLLGWHPNPTIFGVDFSKHNICHLSFHTADLDNNYEMWRVNNLAIINKEKYKKFVDEFNFPFDGKASERVIKEIMD